MLVDQVEVIVNDVRESEIHNLDEVVFVLSHHLDAHTSVNADQDTHHYKIRLQPAGLTELKDTLRHVLQFIHPERIAIEP